MNANAYLSSLEIQVTEAVQPLLGRLALAGEFTLGGVRGVILRPRRGEISDRYLDLLAAEGYAFVVVDGGSYPAFYAREGDALTPMRALPIETPQHFPSEEVLAAWVQLIESSADSRGEAARLGVAQLVARLRDKVFVPERIRPDDDIPVEHLGGNKMAHAEPLRTAAALLAGFRLRPTPSELVRLLVAVSSLLPEDGNLSGLPAVVAPLLQVRQLGSRRLLVSGGAGAEVAALVGAQGMILLPSELRVLEPLFDQLLPDVERVFTEFLHSHFAQPFDGVVLIPPFNVQLSGAQFGEFALAKRGGKVRSWIGSELLFVEHALAATAEGGVLVTVLPEGLLSSSGHADFRAWLLDHARLLAVISLPMGNCFRSTGVKCSVVLLRKLSPTDDYPILMIDVEADDVHREVEAAKSKLDEFLEREVASCA